jgi:hypothetical protein
MLIAISRAGAYLALLFIAKVIMSVCNYYWFIRSLRATVKYEK